MNYLKCSLIWTSMQKRDRWGGALAEAGEVCLDLCLPLTPSSSFKVILEIHLQKLRASLKHSSSTWLCSILWFYRLENPFIQLFHNTYWVPRLSSTVLGTENIKKIEGKGLRKTADLSLHSLWNTMLSFTPYTHQASFIPQCPPFFSPTEVGSDLMFSAFVISPLNKT